MPLKMKENQLNPLQEGVLKSVLKVHSKQVEEAMGQGASGEQVLKDAGIRFGPNQPLPEKSEEGVATTDPLSLVFTGQQPSELEERPIPERISRFGGLFQERPDVFQTRLENEVIIRKMLGMEPLQKGEREKMGIEAQQDIIKAAIKADQAGGLGSEYLSTEYTRASAEFVKVRDSYGRVISAFKDPSPAGDLAGIFAFMKVLDPGSVVRESEFKNAATAQKWVEAHGVSWGKIGRVWRGERLSQEARSDFTNRAGKLFGRMQTQQKKTTSEFNRLAIKNNLDPTRLYPDIGMVSEQTLPSTQKITGQTSSGNKFRKVE